MINKIFHYVWLFEKRYMKHSVRKSWWWFAIKVVVLSPFLALRLLGKLLYGKQPSSKINTQDSPDIKLGNIIDGFTNLAFPDAEVEDLAKKRAAICAECPLAVKTGVYSVIADKRTKHIQGMKCDACGCNLSAKVRSVKDYCPKGKW